MNVLNSTLFGLSAILAYAAAVVVLLRALQADYGAREFDKASWESLLLGWLAALLHGLALGTTFGTAGGFDFSFLSALSVVAWIIVVIVLIATWFKPVDKLGLVVFPLAAAILLLKLSLPETAHPVRTHTWPMGVHILSSMLAYSFLNIAAIQAVLLALQDYGLRSHHTRWMVVRSMPPLQTMEILLFQLIGAGFGLLTVSLATGFVFLENLFAQHLAHKTVLSILAWIVFAMLLVGRVRYGWRGQTAIRWTLSGFIALMLAYFGSKMVLEWILNRA